MPSNPYQPPNAAVSDISSSPKPTRTVLLWLVAAYWVLNGLAHLIQLVPAIPVLSALPGEMLVATALALLIGVLSVWGGIMLIRCSRRAVPILLSVFAIEALWMLVAWSMVSFSNVSTFTLAASAIACASIAYVLFLGKKGALR